MYSQDKKDELMDELVDMESLKVDVGDEGVELQKDLISYFVEGNGDKSDLEFRLELYFYAFKLFCRKPAKIDKNQFFIYLNDSILDFEKINLVMNDLNKFEFVIEALKEENDVFINLNFTLHF